MIVQYTGGTRGGFGFITGVPLVAFDLGDNYAPPPPPPPPPPSGSGGNPRFNGVTLDTMRSSSGNPIKHPIRIG